MCVIASSHIVDPDRPLLDRARAGDFEAFEGLVTRYERPLYALAMRMLNNSADAEETVQDTFLAVVEHLQDFHGESTFHTWLIRIATNKALKVIRRRRTSKTVSVDAMADRDERPMEHPQFVAPWRDDPQQIAQRHETAELIAQALADLDEKYRLVFVLRDIEGLSTEAAAEALGITPGNAKVRLLRARLMLRERLTQLFGDPARRIQTHDHDHASVSSAGEIGVTSGRPAGQRQRNSR